MKETFENSEVALRRALEILSEQSREIRRLKDEDSLHRLMLIDLIAFLSIDTLTYSALKQFMQDRANEMDDMANQADDVDDAARVRGIASGLRKFLPDSIEAKPKSVFQIITGGKLDGD
jgi:hypothetical protein